MQHDARLEALDREPQRPPVQPERDDLDAGRAAHVGGDVRQREAALASDLAALGVGDGRDRSGSVGCAGTGTCLCPVQSTKIMRHIAPICGAAKPTVRG